MVITFVVILDKSWRFAKHSSKAKISNESNSFILILTLKVFGTRKFVFFLGFISMHWKLFCLLSSWNHKIRTSSLLFPCLLQEIVSNPTQFDQSIICNVNQLVCRCPPALICDLIGWSAGQIDPRTCCCTHFTSGDDWWSSLPLNASPLALTDPSKDVKILFLPA